MTSLYQQTSRRVVEALEYGAELWERADGEPHPDAPDGDGTIEEFMAEELMQVFGFRWETHPEDPSRHRLVGQWEDKPDWEPPEDEEEES